MIANRVGEDTPQSSIVLACEQPMTGYHETNFSLAYSSHISWQTPDSPVPVEVYPSLAWDNLFDNRGSLRNISILDRVKDRAEALSRQISSTDKSKLDEYLTSVREVEKRVEGMRKSKDRPTMPPSAKSTVASTMDRPANGLPEDLREHARLMCDIIAIAFQTDQTRVASLHHLPRPFRHVLSVPRRAATATTPPRTTTTRTGTSASRASMSASLPTWHPSWTACRKATAPCSTIPA